MKPHKKRSVRVCIILLFVFVGMTSAGCGRKVRYEDFQAVETAYRIGYIHEDFYWMTKIAYCRQESMPPVTVVEKMGYDIERWMKLYLSKKPRICYTKHQIKLAVWH